MILTASNGLLEAVLSGAVATNQSRIFAGFRTYSTTDSISEGTVVTNSTTAVTVIAAPSGSDTIRPRAIQMQNADTVAITITFRFNASGTLTPVFKATLAVGDTLVYEEGEGWYTRALTGNRKTASFGHCLVAVAVSSSANTMELPPFGAFLDIEAVGAGAGSGGIQTGTAADGAVIGGGGGGSFARAWVARGQISHTYGNGGGAGNTSGTTGTSGGNSIAVVGATTVTAKGGVGAIGTATQARSLLLATWLGGAGQLSTGGDMNCMGAPGEPGLLLNIATTGNYSGSGGPSLFFLGGSGGGKNTNGQGTAASSFGGGAGGSLQVVTTAALNGGSGTTADGRILIRHYT